MHRNEYTDMGSKNVSLREDVYLALKAAKGPDESFSDAIERLLAARDGRHPLYRLVGTLREDEAAEVREAAAAFRERVDADLEPSA